MTLVSSVFPTRLFSLGAHLQRRPRRYRHRGEGKLLVYVIFLDVTYAYRRLAYILQRDLLPLGT